MNDDEKDRIIAKLVRERRELKRSVVCIEDKLRDADSGFRAGAQAVQHSRSATAGSPIHFPAYATYPSIEEFRKLLSNLEAAKVRLQEIEAALDSC